MGMVSNSAEEETTSNSPFNFVRSLSDNVYTSTVTSENSDGISDEEQEVEVWQLTRDVVICGNHAKVQR